VRFKDERGRPIPTPGIKGETNIFLNFGGNLTVSADYRGVGSPAYFAGRAPINMFSGRVRLQF
jgi:hypothetical protein